MRGFTLLELMIVIALIGLIAALAGSNLIPRAIEAERGIALAKCREYYDATWSWMMFTRASEPPRDLGELEQPLREGRRSFLRVDEDPWGTKYRIERENGRNFRIWSNGPDGEPGTGDDICYEPLEDGVR